MAETRSHAGGAMIRKVRTAQFDNHTARVVLDLSAPARIESAEADGRTLTITLAPAAAAEFAALAKKPAQTLPGSMDIPAAPPSPVTASAEPLPPPPAKRAEPPRAKTTDRSAIASATPKVTSATRSRRVPRRAARTGLPVVVIDAGHGGRDPGSPSIDGRSEKDAVLGIAKAIKRELDASGRVRTILTREDDRYIPHRERTGIARRSRAQLFISVHADSFPQKPSVSGATIYTLSENASDKEAARLAARENRSDLIAGVDLASENDDVTSILIDLAQRETMNNSAEFAALLQREMVSAGVPFRSHFPPLRRVSGAEGPGRAGGPAGNGLHVKREGQRLSVFKEGAV